VQFLLEKEADLIVGSINRVDEWGNRVNAAAGREA
jgi:hypothetical protein